MSASTTPSEGSVSDSPESTGSSLITTAEEEEEKPQILPGTKKRRNGKIVGVLRKKYADRPAALNIAPSSTAAKIAFRELGCALEHHLLQLTPGVLTTLNTPPIIDLTDVWTRIQRSFARSRTSDPYQEVLLACFVALGSRRTEHSSITSGSLRGAVRPSNGSALVVQGAGSRRETACRALAQRAVDLAERTNLLSDQSVAAMTVVQVLRVTLFAVQPRHPYNATLTGHLHKVYSKLAAKDGVVQDCYDNLGLSIAELDSYESMISRKPPKISETELHLLYGWHPSQIPGAITRLLEAVKIDQRDASLRVPSRIVALAELRGVIKIQRLVPGPQLDITKVTKMFHRVWEFLDATETSTRSLEGADGLKLALAPHLGAIPMVSETILAAEALRLCQNRVDVESKKLIATSQVRFLTWLKIFIRFMNDNQFGKGGGGNHARALLLCSLDFLPNWIELAVSAASQCAAGIEPLASVGLTWDNLLVLHDGLKHASAVFARSERQEAELSRALSAAGLKDQLMANRIVSAALIDMQPAPMSPLSFFGCCPVFPTFEI